MEQALAQSAIELRALYQASLVINAQHDRAALLQKIVDQAAIVTGMDQSNLHLLDADQMLENVAQHNLPDEYVGMHLALGEGMVGRAAQKGAPVAVEDYQVWDGRMDKFTPVGSRRVLSLPMRIQGRVIGVLSVADTEQIGPFSDSEIHLLSLFADQAAIAIENVRLYAEAQQELTERKRVQEELEVKNADLERYAYTLSHELRTPLVTIRNFLGLVEQDALAGETTRLRADLVHITQATDDMQQLIDGLLKLLRVGRMEDAYQSIAMHELVHEAIERLSERLALDGIEINIAHNMPAVYGDRQRLREAWENLNRVVAFYPPSLFRMRRAHNRTNLSPRRFYYAHNLTAQLNKRITATTAVSQ